MQQIGENTVAWCGVGGRPRRGRSRSSASPTSRRLWEKVAFCMRLDEPDPVAAWREHIAKLRERGAALDALKPDALRYRGPGTDLTVGLLPNARWFSGSGFTKAGDRVRREHAHRGGVHDARPPPRRGHDPLEHAARPGGQVVRGLELTFEDGRIVNVEAETGADLIRGQLATIENADRLGELALVTGESRVGQSETLFYDTLFDENATCHIAYGLGFPFVFEASRGRGPERLPDARRLHGRRPGARDRRDPRGWNRRARHPGRGMAARVTRERLERYAELASAWARTCRRARRSFSTRSPSTRMSRAR